VYAASLEYREFLEHGTPVTFDVPSEPGPVVSGLRLGDRVLVRRTDFGARTASVKLPIVGRPIFVEDVGDKNQILQVK
jgi:hypothetical protein